MSLEFSERKEDDASSRRSDALLSADSKQESHVSSNDQSSVAYSSYTSFSKHTSLTVLTSGTLQASRRSQADIQSRRRRKQKTEIHCTTAREFKPKSNLPPLDFGAAGLVGRDKELSTLKSCYDRMMKKGKKELILVGGLSGSGKSSIIRSMENDIPVEGLFVEGKFDMNTSNEPYSGVATAFDIICRKIKEAGPETLADLRQELQNELGDKPGMLMYLIPEINDIMLGENSADESTVGSIERVDETEGGVDRLRFAFRALARVFSSFFSPLILFLDDLQWADVSSLQVLDYLVSDTENENPLMIIGSYRSEEVDENSLLHNKMVALREKTEKFHFQMTELMIESFSVSNIEKLVTAVLPSLRADHIVGLAALCHKRTLGNPFFTIEFLKMLHFEGMMKFDQTTKTWYWNLSEIRKETMSTANVVVMLEQHLRKLPEQVQALLQCAACLGSSFSEPTIDLVWSVYGRRLVETKTAPVSSLLPLLVADDIFEKSEQQYRWTHDKLQEAALSLSGSLRDTFQLDIGKTLYYGLTKEQVEEDLFTIVDLINNGNTSKRPEFAAVNLRAAEKARDISAFQAASEYASEGISLLQETDWVQNKSVSLNLYTIGAEAELLLGNVDAAERYRDVVLSRSDLSTLEMLPLQIGKAKALGDVELKSKEALEYCLSLLKNHGCRLTWVRPLALPQAVASLIRTVKLAKAKPHSFYEEMKPSDDTKLKYIGYLLSKAAYNAYTAGDTAMYLLTTVKLVDVTMESGVNEFSATAFTFLGVMSVIVLQDYEAMERFVNIALGMLKKFRGMHAAESIFVGHQLGLFWVKPPEMGRVVAEKAILEGRREGDLVFTSWSIMQHVIYLPYTTGRPIQTILEGCPNILAEFEETKAGAHILCAKNYYQMLLNLNDPSCENPSVHIGKIYTDTKEEHKGNLVHLADKVIAEGELVFWNEEDYEVTAKRALKVGETHAKIGPAIYLNQIESFHRAVALYAAAIKTKKGKYKRAANKIRKRMATLAQYENNTIQYYSVFLTAEHLASNKKLKEASMKYEQALEVAGKLGHLHHLGLLNERYSDFLKRELLSGKESRYRLEQAIGYYREWGAVHKAKALESRL
ncbi:unnamed protein product [Cylindrotheca closterium]|uniref:Orc1-like AAA ATPase domain-containing protein n=1 Tax=Cylindrotheca closterium TaxID=2856 RepID=A0AAD2FZ28_9STRA|nr:unnamed protein product [Cylindrotheca closterium]